MNFAFPDLESIIAVSPDLFGKFDEEMEAVTITFEADDEIESDEIDFDEEESDKKESNG